LKGKKIIMSMGKYDNNGNMSPMKYKPISLERMNSSMISNNALNSSNHNIQRRLTETSRTTKVKNKNPGKDKENIIVISEDNLNFNLMKEKKNEQNLVLPYLSGI
jgi:hypothetical protein